MINFSSTIICNMVKRNHQRRFRVLRAQSHQAIAIWISSLYPIKWSSNKLSCEYEVCLVLCNCSQISKFVRVQIHNPQRKTNQQFVYCLLLQIIIIPIIVRAALSQIHFHTWSNQLEFSKFIEDVSTKIAKRFVFKFVHVLVC